MSNRFMRRDIINVGEKVMFDNSVKYLKHISPVKIVGTITRVELDDPKMVEVTFSVNDVDRELVENVPYFLLQ